MAAGAAELEDVYCTLLMSDNYLPGAAVLAHSLRDAGTKKKIAVLVTVDTLLYNTLDQLKQIFDYVIPVDKTGNPNLENLARLDRLDLRFAFTKIALWNQTRFRKIVYIDADVVALRAPDELFELDHIFAAAPDIGWPDIFNSGVMLLTPNQGDYRALCTLASSGASFDGADQGLLNEYFAGRPWHRLSFTYNCTLSSSYQYEPAYRHFRSSIKMTHFIGKRKPWQLGRKAMSTADSSVFREIHGRWWTVYDRHYPEPRSSALGQLDTQRHHLMQFVNDEHSSTAAGWATAGHRSSLTTAEATSTELPFTDPSDAMETLQTQPPMVSEQRQFEAPQNPWDATKGAPPAAARAEAASFPKQKYQMSSSTGLFQPPQSLGPPSDYAVPAPATLADKPAHIFPWEDKARKPTRVFASPPTAPPEPSNHAPGPIGAPRTDPLSASNLAAVNNTAEAFPRTNAWDNNASIGQYVRAVREAQSKHGAVQVIHHDRDKTLSNVSTEGVEEAGGTVRRPPRQESLILTDFPTEVERPSLPVTPAPVRRPMFWEGERDSAGELPAAEGVPHQSEWDPHERLEQLRRSSLATAEELPKHETVKNPPLRAVPETSSEMPGSSTEGAGQQSASEANTSKTRTETEQ